MYLCTHGPLTGPGRPATQKPLFHPTVTLLKIAPFCINSSTSKAKVHLPSQDCSLKHRCSQENSTKPSSSEHTFGKFFSRNRIQSSPACLHIFFHFCKSASSFFLKPQALGQYSVCLQKETLRLPLLDMCSPPRTREAHLISVLTDTAKPLKFWLV